MPIHLQQNERALSITSNKVGVASGRVPLIADNVFLLVLVLVIIPTISGVTLIA